MVQTRHDGEFPRGTILSRGKNGRPGTPQESLKVKTSDPNGGSIVFAPPWFRLPRAPRIRWWNTEETPSEQRRRYPTQLDGEFLGGPFFGRSKNSPPGETALPLEGEFPPTPGWGIPSAGDVSSQETSVLPLLRQLRQAQWGAGFVQGQRRQLTVTLPEAAPAAPALSAEELDLACERDARRYGGGFGLY